MSEPQDWCPFPLFPIEVVMPGYVKWFNNHCMLRLIEHFAEAEAHYYEAREIPDMA
ncbi:MAG: hypothetical protein NXH71_01480 [Erythrobacteraceae bacterium]|nr:hypothetical protein [Erythrobacteraceae bacterium]